MSKEGVRHVAITALAGTALAASVSVALVAWAEDGLAPAEQGRKTSKPVPEEIICYPGATLQRVQVWEEDPEDPERESVYVVLMFGSDAPKADVAAYFEERLRPHGHLLHH